MVNYSTENVQFHIVSVSPPVPLPLPLQLPLSFPILSLPLSLTYLATFFNSVVFYGRLNKIILSEE